MTHSAGVPFATGPRPDLKRMNDSDYARERLGELRPIHRPGLVHIYHGLTWGPLIREIVSAATGRNIREILATEILDPLGFAGPTTGWHRRMCGWWRQPCDRKPLPAPIAAAMKAAIGGSMQQIIPLSNSERFLTSVVPSSSTVSTADELSRFAEILCRGGELDGCR